MRVASIIAGVLTLFIAGSLVAQQPGAPAGAVPAGGGDKNLQVDDAKMRSMEMERVKRDAEKMDRKNQNSPAPPSVNFQQVKEDFETIQRMQDGIVAAYSKSKEIDYKQISANAEQMNQSSVRLESNLFPPAPAEKKKDKKSAQAASAPASEPVLPQDVKSLIVEQDNTLSAFVTNPMFTNPQVVNQDNNAKAHSDLQRLIKLSAALQQEAEKLKK